VRVLIVEDQPKLAALLARGLREEGHAADVAGRGEDALWMALAAQYDAIVLDIMLPGIDGLETCRELRRQSASSPRPATSAACPSSRRPRASNAASFGWSSTMSTRTVSHCARRM
jgi:CheY-like chemotaxis protein